MSKTKNIFVFLFFFFSKHLWMVVMRKGKWANIRGKSVEDLGRLKPHTNMFLYILRVNPAPWLPRFPSLNSAPYSVWIALHWYDYPEKLKLTHPAKSQKSYHTRNIVYFNKINAGLPFSPTFGFITEINKMNSWIKTYKEWLKRCWVSPAPFLKINSRTVEIKNK